MKRAAVQNDDLDIIIVSSENQSATISESTEVVEPSGKGVSIVSEEVCLNSSEKKEIEGSKTVVSQFAAEEVNSVACSTSPLLKIIEDVEEEEEEETEGRGVEGNQVFLNDMMEKEIKDDTMNISENSSSPSLSITEANDSKKHAPSPHCPSTPVALPYAAASISVVAGTPNSVAPPMSSPLPFRGRGYLSPTMRRVMESELKPTCTPPATPPSNFNLAELFSVSKEEQEVNEEEENKKRVEEEIKKEIEIQQQKQAEKQEEEETKDREETHINASSSRKVKGTVVPQRKMQNRNSKTPGRIRIAAEEQGQRQREKQDREREADDDLEGRCSNLTNRFGRSRKAPSTVHTSRIAAPRTKTINRNQTSRYLQDYKAEAVAESTTSVTAASCIQKPKEKKQTQKRKGKKSEAPFQGREGTASFKTPAKERGSKLVAPSTATSTHFSRRSKVEATGRSEGHRQR